MHTSENLDLVIVDEGDPADLNTVSANFEEIDDVVGSLVDAMTNAKALLGQLGLDTEGNPVVNAEQARSTLGAASNSVIGTVPSGKTLQGQIETLQDSVALSLNRAYDRAGGAAWQMWDNAEGTNISFYYDKNAKTLNVDMRVDGTWIGRKTIASWP